MADNKFASTSEGTGSGAVERYIPRIVNNIIRLENIAPSAISSVSTPAKIDGGVLQALGMLNITEKEANIIMQAAEILKKASNR